MHGVDFMESFEPVDDLFEEGGGLIFCEAFLDLKILLKISSVAVLHSDELSSLWAEGIDVSNDILIVAFLEDSYLCPDKFFEFRSFFHEYLGYSFDCYSWISLLIIGLIDNSPSSLP
jgi:hypothetical protein